MKNFIIPLLTVAVVVGIVFAGCVPEAAPPVTPEVGCTPPARTPPGGATSWVGTWDPETYIFDPVHISPAQGIPTAEPKGIWDGFAVKPDGTPYHFSWLICTVEPPWCVSSYGVAETYFKRAGAELTMFNSDLSMDAELAALDDAVVRGGVDAFMLLPTDTVGLIPKIEEITDKGIPCFSWGNIVPGPALVSSSAHGYIMLGEYAGRAFAEYAEERGELITVYEVWGQYGKDDAIERHTGLHNILDPHPLVTVIESGECLFMDAMAADAVITTFSAHPEWDAIYDMGSMIGGVIEGLATIDQLYPVGDPRHVFVVATGGAPVAMEGLEGGFVDAVVGNSPYIQTDACIKSIFHYVILGQPVYRFYSITLENVTIADADNPIQWGNALRWDIPFDDYPVLHQPDVIETPTLDMRMKFCGY